MKPHVVCFKDNTPARNVGLFKFYAPLRLWNVQTLKTQPHRYFFFIAQLALWSHKRAFIGLKQGNSEVNELQLTTYWRCVCSPSSAAGTQSLNI